MATQAQSDAWLAAQTPENQALIRQIAGLLVAQMNANNSTSRLGASLAAKRFQAYGGQPKLDALMLRLKADPVLYAGWQAHRIKTGGLGQGTDVLLTLAAIGVAAGTGLITPQTAATIPGQATTALGVVTPPAAVTVTALPPAAVGAPAATAAAAVAPAAASAIPSALSAVGTTAAEAAASVAGTAVVSKVLGPIGPQPVPPTLGIQPSPQPANTGMALLLGAAAVVAAFFFIVR